MAKSKNNKILAMALCASVMAGIYATPVLAANSIENGTSKVEIDSNGDINFILDDNKIGSIDNRYGYDRMYLNGSSYAVQFSTTNGTAAMYADGRIRGANGAFLVDNQGNVTATNVSTEQYDLSTIGYNTQKITFDGKNTKVEGKLVADKFGISRDGFYVDENGVVKASKFFVGKNYENALFRVDDAGNVTLAEGAEVDGVDVSELSTTVGETNKNVAGITREELPDGSGITTVEGATSFDQTGMSINSNGGTTAIVGGQATFNDGEGGIAQIYGGNVTATGDIVSSYNDKQYSLNTIGANTAGVEREELADGSGITTVEGATSFDQTGMSINSNGGTSAIVGGQATFNDGEGGITQIMGGAITAETLNGKDINDLVVGADIEDDLANVGGISRQQDENGVFYTNVEGTLTVSEKGLAGIVDDNAINLNSDGINLAAGSNAISITDAGIGFAGTVYTGNANDFHFTYNGFAGVGGTNIAAGNYTLSDLVDTVADIYDRTQGISYENGTTTVDGNLNVQGDASTGEGGNMNAESGTIGDVTMSDGNINTDGVVNAGSGTIGEVTMENGNINTDGVINAGGGTIGDVTMSDGNINTDGVINAAGGGTIGGATVDKDGNINTDGIINAGGGTIGDVTMSNGSVTAGQTTVDNEGVSIADNTIISDHDVVINDKNPDERVSLADVGNRVGNLEQGVSELNNRVGELEDRIDKVGAMAAAIANLRTMGYDPAAPTEVAVGLGQYRDETGAALGLFHYPNRDFMLSLSVSTSGDEVMGGIGATWKFGRKSPEKVAEIKKAQAEADVRRAEEAKLAKAEEMKKAAKEAKIKAQQERHAKLAAERAAQAEAK